MTILLLVPAAYIAGVFSGHVVVAFVKKQISAIHTKLDAIISKDKVLVGKRGNN
jgi:hypothetical protein